MVVQRLDVLPRVTSIRTAEERCGFDAGVDGLRLVLGTRRDMPHTAHGEIGTFLELRRSGGRVQLLSGSSAVGAGGPPVRKMPGRRGGRAARPRVPGPLAGACARP